MLDHISLILILYACCFALNDDVDGTHLSPFLADDLISVVFLDHCCSHDAFAELFADEVG